MKSKADTERDKLRKINAIEDTAKRHAAILKAYKAGHTDLFNWCNEYNEFINDGVCCCVSSEWDYMLKKSYEDRDSPVSYEDFDDFDVDKAREKLVYEYEDNGDEYKEYANDPNGHNRRVKTKGDFEVFVNSLDKDELVEAFDELNLDRDDARAEVLEWWILRDPLEYSLEKQGEVFLNGAWGRQTSGQMIKLDSCCIQAFIDRLH